MCNIFILLLVKSKASANTYPIPATRTDQINAAGTFSAENFNGVILAIPIIIGLIFLIPYINRDPKMNSASYLCRKSIIFWDFSSMLGYFCNNFDPYILPIKYSVCSVMRVPKKANNITNSSDIRPLLQRRPAVKTATSPSIHAKRKTA